MMCPVCCELLEEPVSLPCGHELCLDCFRSSLDAGNLHCPLCRQRISAWARRCARNPVNSQRKEELNRLYANFSGSIESLRLIASLQREEERQPKFDTVESVDNPHSEKEEKERKEREVLDQQEALRLQQEEDKRVELEIRQQVEQDKKLAQKLAQEFQSQAAVTTMSSGHQSPLRTQVKNKSEPKKTQVKEEEQPQLTLYHWFDVLPKK